MAEFAVVVGLLAWLLLCLPLIQRYHSLSQAAQMDARVLAHAQARQLAGAGGPSPPGAPSAVIDLPPDPQLPRALPSRVAYDLTNLGVDHAAAGLSLRLPYRLAGATAGVAFLRSRVVEARVDLPTAPGPAAPAPFDGGGLVLRATYVLPVDDWSASGPAQVIERVRPLVPTARLALLRDLARSLAAPLALVEPAFRSFCPGHIDPEIVPEDRLRPLDKPLPAAGRIPPC